MTDLAYEVEFFPERVCGKHKRCTPGSDHCADPPCQKRHYEIDGEAALVDVGDIDSSTTITRELGDKFGQGAWWGQGIGVAGVLEILRRGSDFADGIRAGELDAAQVVEVLKAFKLTTNHQRDEASDRGNSIHKAAERWAKTGELPDPFDAPQGEEGYWQALRSCIVTEQLEPRIAEVPVGSKRYGYAGTPDLVAGFPKLQAEGLLDWKSKSRPLKPNEKASAYEAHHFQIRSYEDARVEMGFLPSDFQVIANLYPDGHYALVQGVATTEQWQAALAFYRGLVELRNTIKEAA